MASAEVAAMSEAAVPEVAVPSEEPQEVEETLARSPRFHVDSKPIATDSMITVRLSEPDSAALTIVDDGDVVQDVLEDDAIVNDVVADETQEVDETAGDDASELDSIASTESDLTIEPFDSSSRPVSKHTAPELHVDTQTAEAVKGELADEVLFSGRPESEWTIDSARESDFEKDTPADADTDADADTETDTETDAENIERSRTPSASSESTEGGNIDWVELDKTETEKNEEADDEATAFLLARLEQENTILDKDPRFGLKQRERKQSRPPSIHVLKKLVSEPPRNIARYSQLPEPPPMTELDFWAALVKDYAETAQRLPTLTAKKIQSGIPPPLRGVVWISMTGARDSELGDEYEKLFAEKSPYEGIIGKDVGRSFPGVEMFREADGEGQQKMGKVLRCFSLYDKEIGYCQGLGFLVGPLLMQMGDKDAFCVLVRLMNNFDLRSCYLPDLSGLHLRIFQFQKLLAQEMPDLTAHLASLQVEAAYLSQWFLSFFAVTCPLPLLFRIYDVIFAEGASETIMRVALALMRKNKEKLMLHTEFEEVMQLLLGRSLWEPYAGNADDLVEDFVSLNSVVSREKLQSLEKSFKETKAEDVAYRFQFLPDATAAASRFLGRLWAFNAPPKQAGLTPGHAATASTTSRPGSFLRRTPSKQSIAETVQSTDISSEGTDSMQTTTTDPTVISRDSSADALSLKSKAESLTIPILGAVSKEDKDLHNQIEDLLMALSEMQRDQAIVASQLQREREERSEDQRVFEQLVRKLRPQAAVEDLQSPSPTVTNRRRTLAYPQDASLGTLALPTDVQGLVERAQDRLDFNNAVRRSSMLETKQRLRESLTRSKDQLSLEISKSAELSRQLDKQERESSSLKEQLKEARGRIQESYHEKAKLEKMMQDMRRFSVSWSDEDATSAGKRDSIDPRASISSVAGLRELKLGRKEPPNGNSHQGHIPKRSTSLATQAILSTKGHKPQSEEELLVELVSVKTSEALARQELEEVKSKLDALRKMLGVPTPVATPPAVGITESIASHAVAALTGTGAKVSPSTERVPGSAATPVSGGWFSGWGRRNLSFGVGTVASPASTTTPPLTTPETEKPAH